MIRPSTAAPIIFEAVDSVGEPVTGVADLLLTIVDADEASATFGHVWDWSTSAFSASPSQATAAMSEVNATHAPGHYSVSWPGAGTGYYIGRVTQSPGTTVYNVPASIELQVRQDSAPGDQMALTTDAITSTSVAASAVTKIQSGLATAASVAALPTASAIADAVLDEALSGHATAGTLGAAVALLDVAVSSRATNSGVWATVTGNADWTYGECLELARKWITNEQQVDTTSSGRMRLFDDDGETVLLTWTLRDASGNAITTPSGSPARRGEAS